MNLKIHVEKLCFFFPKYAACEGEISPLESAMREIPPVTNLSTLMYNFFIGAINFARKRMGKYFKKSLIRTGCVRARPWPMPAPCSWMCQLLYSWYSSSFVGQSWPNIARFCLHSTVRIWQRMTHEGSKASPPWAYTHLLIPATRRTTDWSRCLLAPSSSILWYTVPLSSFTKIPSRKKWGKRCEHEEFQSNKPWQSLNLWLQCWY